VVSAVDRRLEAGAEFGVIVESVQNRTLCAGKTGKE